MSVSVHVRVRLKALNMIHRGRSHPDMGCVCVCVYEVLIGALQHTILHPTFIIQTKHLHNQIHHKRHILPRFSATSQAPWTLLQAYGATAVHAYNLGVDQKFSIHPPYISLSESFHQILYC